MFKLRFAGDPADVVTKHLVKVRQEIAALTGPVIPKPTTPAEQWQPFIPEDSDLAKVPLGALKAEAFRLGQLIGLDDTKQKQLSALNDKITKNEAALSAANAAAANAAGAQARITVLAENRKASYASLFDGFASEQAELTKMYEPLSTMLSSQRGTLGKLSFSVRRVVDVDAWAARGEDLMDLRTGTTFRGRGELFKVATDTLLPAWESGASGDVADAMATFRNDHDQHIIEQARVPQSNLPAFRGWANDVAAWLNSTDHISVSYGIQYDGVDIEQLSPGTRGIVLLLLYLAVDQSDDRPLIIDQPEENLDPKSIFVELVGRFVETRHRRQIIIVTHNANLVVNTDADQVIVASAGAHVPGGLPDLSYLGGASRTRPYAMRFARYSKAASRPSRSALGVFESDWHRGRACMSKRPRPSTRRSGARYVERQAMSAPHSPRCPTSPTASRRASAVYGAATRHRDGLAAKIDVENSRIEFRHRAPGAPG